MEPAILLDLDVHNANALVLEPAFNYDNIFQRRLGVYKFVTGKTTYKMTHLSRPSNVLQPKLGCDDWKPTVNFSLRPWEIGSKEYELMGQQCPDEFDDACARNLRSSSASDEVARLGLGAAITAIDMAMAMQIRRSMVDSIYKIGWFGNINFGAEATAGIYDLSGMEIREKAKLVNMLQHQNGWWSEIKARVALTTEYGRIRYVDTNDGTYTGNALNPANIADYLRQLRLSSHPMLQFWNIDRPQAQWPVYMLQSGLFNALIAYYQSLGTEIANRLIVDGVAVPGATTFDGYPVMMIPEWDMFDYETGNILASGQSKNQRAIFTAAENLCGVAAMNSLEGKPASALMIQASPLLKDKGKKWMYASLGFGFGIAQPILMTVGYNSSNTYDFTV